MRNHAEIIDDMIVEYKTIKVHEFLIDGFEEPVSLGGLRTIHEWKETDQGKFVKDHAVGKLEFYCILEHETYHTRVCITATFNTKDLTLYYLKYPKEI